MLQRAPELLGSGEKPRRSCIVAENMKAENATTRHVTVPHKTPSSWL
jgi:hypothetical protein